MKLFNPKKRDVFLRRMRFKSRSRGIQRVVKKKRSAPKVKVSPRVVLVPRILSLYQMKPRHELILMLTKLRKYIINQELPVILNFSQTEKVAADGALLLLAELSRMINIVKGAADFTVVPPENNKVSQVLRQIGLYGLLGANVDVTPSDSDVIHWKCATGEAAEGQKYEDILSNYDGELAEVLQKNFYTGITEAMTNVVKHAYEYPRNDGCPKSDQNRWWAFSQYQNGILSVVFCDLGAGIPGTLPQSRPSVWEKLVKRGKQSDAKVIKYAVEDSVSRTGQSHRGKGLAQIVKVIEAASGGNVCVYSNSGALECKGALKKMINFKESILGTLIFWCVPVQQGDTS